MQAIDRRQFLRADFRGNQQSVRPPWATAEQDFLNRCTRCGECVRQCPQGIIVQPAHGYPEINFSHGECVFCAQCVKACAPAALLFDQPEQPPWALRADIGRGCLASAGIECRVCQEQCPQGAIRFIPKLHTVAQPLLDSSACNGCGACIAPCPTQAINMFRGTGDPDHPIVLEEKT